MNEAAGNNKKIIAAVAVLVLIAIMIFGAKAFSTDANKDTGASSDGAAASAQSQPSEQSSGTSQASDQPTQTDSATYKDGQYSATGNYRSPGGEQTITIKVTLQDGTITDTSAESGAKDGTSSEYQGKFISGYKDQVVGKSLDEVQLDRVSGSSLTPQGFNDAIDQIKQSAKA